MAVVYFTSNASTGAGSLAEAIQNAQPGDVVRPDETVFERGSTIEIVLAATLAVDKNLTFDGGPFRVRLNGGGAIRCAIVSANVTATFVGFDFVRGDAASSNGGGINGAGTTDVTCIRCGFYGCEGANGGGAYLTGVSVLRDCVVIGCRATTSGGGIYLFKSPTLNGVTVAGCVAPTGSGVRIVNATVDASNSILCDVTSSTAPTYRGCVVNVAPSQIGFVAPPPDNLTAENWDENAWQNWDLRLLDDASGAPSPYRDSGDVDAMSQYDVDGAFRGRETNGATTCSPGAYETLQADLFWIGRDATGATGATPSFLNSDGWATSRFADASGDAAPQVGQALFVDADVAFVDAAPQNAELVVVGGANVSTGAATTASEIALTLGLGATYSVSSSVRAVRFAAGSRVVLTGGTLSFDAASQSSGAVSWLSGRLVLSESSFAFDALAVPPDADLNIDGAKVNVESLSVADGATVDFSGVDATLAATESATVGAATFAGVGYVATPPGTDLTSATFGAYVRSVDYSAGVATFAATATGPTTATLVWSATDAAARVCVERENAAAPNGWEVVAITPTEDASPLEVALSGKERFRIFDGATFRVDAAWSSTFGQQFVVLSSYFRAANEKRTWGAKTKVISNTLNVKVGQSVTILARIADAFDTEALLLNNGTNIVSVSYSAMKKTGSLSSNETPIEGHVQIAVPVTCVLEAPQTSDAWEETYNFILTPDVREKPIFPTSGNYSIKIEIVLADGNPITFYVNVEVS